MLARVSPPRLLAATTASAVLTYLSSADPIVPALAWIAPVPILALAFGRGRRAAEGDGISLRFTGAGTPPVPLRETPSPSAGSGLHAHSPARLAVGAFLAAFAGNLSWVALYHGILPVAPLMAFAALFGLAFAIAVSLTAWAAVRGGAWPGVLLFPSLWAAFEFGVSTWSPHGTAGSIAYSQIDFVPLVQIAAWTGLFGITFLVQFVAAGAAALIGTRTERGTRGLLLAVPVTVLVIVVASGAWRLQGADGEHRVLVGLVSIDGGMRRFDATAREEAMPIVFSYLDAVGTLAGRQAEAIVMPEKMVGVAPAYEEEVSNLFGAAAEQRDVLLVAGFNLGGRTQARNVATVFSRGRRALEYDKRRLVPGLERMYTPGETPGLYRAPGGMTGVAICKDMDFAEIGREYSASGVGLLFVPAWDFTRDGRLHSRMAVMRGVEGGYSVARAAANGLLTGSDAMGHVLFERPSDAAGQSMLLASLPLGRGKTFYGEHGDWFGWSAFAAASVVIALAALKGR